MARNARLHSLLLIALFFLPLLSHAQQNPIPATASSEQAAPWKFGAEVDLLPYINGGYYGSGFLGRGAWRVRAVGTRSDTPSFLVSSGFEKKRTDAGAVILDRFFGQKRNDMRGFWAGAGMEFWRSRIRQDGASQFTYFNNGVFTAGGGYVWNISRHLYVNPWSAGHFTVAGNRKINVSGKSYEQPIFTPELSVKFGVVF